MGNLLDTVRAKGRAIAEEARDFLDAAQDLYDEGVITAAQLKDITDSLERGYIYDAMGRLERAVATRLLEDHRLVAVPQPDEPVRMLRRVLDGY